jgi:hypothetical protein
MNDRYHVCIDCKQPFTSENVHSPEGWRETQISGMCEDCFDDLFVEAESMEPDDEEAPAF